MVVTYVVLQNGKISARSKNFFAIQAVEFLISKYYYIIVPGDQAGGPAIIKKEAAPFSLLSQPEVSVAQY